MGKRILFYPTLKYRDIDIEKELCMKKYLLLEPDRCAVNQLM